MKRKDFLDWLKYISQITNANNIINALKTTNLNILFLSGDKDYTFLDGTLKAHKSIPNSIFKILNQCGHACIIEKSVEFNEESYNFLKEREN
jgi:pimeloyl-ACP methyl ester carboxylesterase